MFTRTELELLSLRELRNLASQYGIKPMGNPAHKTSWIVALLSFAEIAVRQMRLGKGMRNPSAKSIQLLGNCLEEIGIPTQEQASLIRITMEGKRVMSHPDIYDQYKLLNLHKAKILIERVISLINQ